MAERIDKDKIAKNIAKHLADDKCLTVPVLMRETGFAFMTIKKVLDDMVIEGKLLRKTFKAGTKESYIYVPVQVYIPCQILDLKTERYKVYLHEKDLFAAMKFTFCVW